MRITRPIRSLIGLAFLLLSSLAQGQVAFEELPSATLDDDALDTALPNDVLFDFTNEDYPSPGAMGAMWKLADYHLSLTFHTGKDHVAMGSDMAINTFGPVKVKVKVEGTTVLPVATAFSEEHELIIDHEHPEAVLELDYTTRYHGFRRLKVYLVSYDNAALPAAYQATTELLIEHRRRKNITPGISTSSYELAARSITSPDGDRLRFNWDHGTHASNAQLRYPAYRFELLRLYNIPAPGVDPATVTDELLNATKVDWSQALSIDLEAQAQHVDLVLAEGTGFYVWRVRPLTDYYEGGYPDPRNWGAWSAHTGFEQNDQPTGLVKNGTPILTDRVWPVTGQGAHVFYYKQFDAAMNWSYSRIFSEAAPENGIPIRFGEHMTFANGLQQVTQEQSYLSSLGYPMIVETLYDYAGRPAVKTLPVPAPEGQHAVAYQPALMEADLITPRPYGPLDFDTDGSYLDNSMARPTNGFDYYSSANTAERQVPYAEGYPFTRSLFHPDGRVKQQSAPGAAMSFDGSAPRTSKTYYGAASATELARVFGEEAYEAVAVHKVLTIDPNGVLSMSFQDKEGKILATCLGNYDGTALEPLSPAEDAAIHVHEEVLRTTVVNDHVNEKSTEIVSPGDLEVVVSYDLGARELDPCYLECVTCDLTIEFFAYNKETPQIDLFQAAGCNNEPIHFPQGVAPAYFNTNCPASFDLPTCTLSLEAPGTYIIGRRIRTNNLSSAAPGADLLMNEHLANVDAAFEALFTAPTIGGISLDDWIERLSDGTDDLEDLHGAEGLYAALGEPDLNGDYHIPFGGTEPEPCREIVIPFIECEECGGVLADTLLAYLAHAIGLELTPANFTEQIDLLFAPGTITTYFAYPESGRWDATYDWTLFSDLVQALLSEPGSPDPYPCDQIKACWQNAVDLFLTMQDTPLPPIDPGTIPGNAQTAPIPIPEPHLMDIFLDCLGRNMEGWATLASYTPGYLTHAFSHFYYPDPPPFDTQQQEYVNKIDACVQNLYVWLPFGFDLHDPADLLTMVDFDGAGPTPPVTAAQAIFDCMNNVDWDNPAASSPADGVAALADDCHQACYSHRDEFREQVLGFQPSITQGDLDCYVNAFLNSCYAKCGELVMAPSPGGIGDEDALAFLQDVLLGRLVVSQQAAGECASGWPALDFDPAGSTPNTSSYPPLTVFPDMPPGPGDDMPEMASMLNGALDHILDFLKHYETDPGYTLFGWKAVRDGITEESDVVEFAWDSDHPGFQVCGLRITGSLFDGTNDVPLMDLASLDPATVGIRKIEITLGGTVVFRFTHQYVGPINARDDGDLDLMMQAAAHGFHSFTDVEGTFTSTGGLDFIDRTYTPGTPPSVTSAPFPDGYPACAYGIDGNVSDLLTAHTNAGDGCWNADNSWVILLRTGCTYGSKCTPPYCFRFERGLPDNVGQPHAFDFYSCATINAQLVASLLSAQRAALKAQARGEYEHAYQTLCAAPDVNEDFFVDYTLDQYHYTLYYYDRAGRLMATVPPKGVDRIPIDPSDNTPGNDLYNLTEALAHPMAHTMRSDHRYNSLGQPVSQVTPNGGTTRMYYDLKGRLRISRDAKQLADAVLQPFSYTKYDDLDRVVEVGEGSLATDAIDLGAGELGVATLLSAAPGFPANGTDKTVTVYTTPAADAAFLDGRPQRFLSNRVSYAYSDQDGSGLTLGDRVITYYSYDPHGNVEWIVQDIPRLGRNYLSYEYDLLSGRVLQVHYNPGRSDEFHHRYAYDEDGRLLLTETSTDGVIWDRDATSRYYPHGPVRRTELGEDHVQGLDYSYTLQGWLKGINDPTLDFRDDGKDGQYDDGTPSPVLPHPGTGRDAFGMALRYFNTDYAARSSVFDDADMLAATDELFNGNIAGWSYRTRTIGNQYDCCLPPDGEPWVGDLDFEEEREAYFSGAQGNRYKYDLLNRLKKSHWHRFYDADHNGTAEWVLPTGHDYRETFEYDANGNISDCTRNGFPLESLLGGSAIDELHYNYTTPNTDRLSSVSESLSTPGLGGDLEDQNSGNYTYGPSGDLLTDDQANIVDIDWTPYGKIRKITYDDGRSIGFGYDAAGHRVWKVVRPDNAATPPGEPSNAVWTFYVRDAQGDPLAIYRQWEQLIPDAGGAYARYTDLEEEPLYGSSRLGSRLANIRVGETQYDAGQVITVPPSTQQRQALQRLELAVQRINDPTPGAPYIRGYNPSATNAGIITANGLKTPGLTTSNVYRAEDDNGNTLFSAHFTDRTDANGQHYTYVGVRDAANALMFQGAPVTTADHRRAAISAQVPNAPDQHYLLTLAANGKPYAQRIDLGAQQLAQANIPLSLPGDHYQYGYGMAVIDDRTAYGRSFLYLKRYQGGTAQLIAIDLDRLATNGHVLTADMVQVLDSFASADALMAGEMQVSPQGHYLALVHALAGRIKLPIRKGSGSTGVIRMYGLSADHSGTQLIGSLQRERKTINSLDFTSESTFYWSETGLSPTSILASGTLCYSGVYAFEYPPITVVELNANGFDVRHTADGSLLAVGHQGRKYLRIPNADYNDVPDPYGDIGQGYRLLPHMALQPLVITTGQPIKYRSLGQKRYELADHLGNVRVTVSDRNLGDWDLSEQAFIEHRPQMLSRADYYAFGWNIPGRSYSSDSYRFGFQGQEKDDEIHGATGTSYAFEYRMHDPRIGRFLSIDPLAAKYPWNSPYAFSENQVIQFIELEGLEKAKTKANHNATPRPNFDNLKKAGDHAAKANQAAKGILTTEVTVGANVGLGVHGSLGPAKAGAGVTVVGETVTARQEGWIAGSPQPTNVDADAVILGYGVELQLPDAVSVKMGGAALRAGVTYDGQRLEGTGRDTWTFGAEMEIGGDVGDVDVSTDPADALDGKVGVEVTVGPLKGEASVDGKSLGTFIDNAIQAIDAIKPLPKFQKGPPPQRKQ
ncbi:MAG: hypothetical protein JST66_02765 [Bacteroidetes bacterium]|nr:hypothetical protein [Bacteroidota bacterium]